MASIKRKIIQIGRSTQLVSLPRSWAKKFNLQKGAELEVEESGKKLIVSTQKDLSLSELELDITDMDRTSLLFYIRSAYRKGYDVMKIHYGNPTTTHFRLGTTMRVSSIIHEEIRRFIGVEIIQQKEDGCVIKSILEHSGKDFDIILRRIFMLLTETMQELVRGLEKKDYQILETINDRHDTITRFISYCMRLLNKYNYENFEQIPTMYYLIALLEDITDIIKWVARDAIHFKVQLKPHNIQIVKDISFYFEKYHEFFYKYDIKKIIEMYRLRHIIINAIRSQEKKSTPEEMIIVSKISHVPEILVNLTQSKMVLEL